PDAMIASLLVDAEARRTQEAEATRREAKKARAARDAEALRERLEKAFDYAYGFPNEETKAGRKPCADGFRRWADRFLALACLMQECDAAIKGLHLRERLQAISHKRIPAALKCACDLLLRAQEGEADAVASAIEKTNADGELRRFVLWLPFIL